MGTAGIDWCTDTYSNLWHFVKKHQNLSISSKLATFCAKYHVFKAILVNRRTAWCNRRVAHKKGGICHRENMVLGEWNFSTEGGL